MIRFMNLNTAFLALTLLVAYGTYHVKYDAQRELKQIKAIDRQIEQEKERSRVLAADWALLNEPGRLQRLAQRHLALAAIEPVQVVSVVELRSRAPVLTASQEQPQEEEEERAPSHGLIKQAGLQSGQQSLIIRR